MIGSYIDLYLTFYKLTSYVNNRVITPLILTTCWELICVVKLVESTLKEHTIIFCLVQAFLSQGNNTSIFTELLSPNSQLINSNILEYYYLTQYPVNSGLVSLCNIEPVVFALVLQHNTTKESMFSLYCTNIRILLLIYM